LTASYSLLAAFLKQWDIEFIAPSHGLFLFAKLAKCARTAEEEKVFFDELAVRAGIRVGEGRFYKGAEGHFGWARLCFSVDSKVMQEALRRMEGFLEKRR
jgi:aspartate/methionine/tyrosine aminotransferase